MKIIGLILAMAENLTMQRNVLQVTPVLGWVDINENVEYRYH